MQSMEYFKQFLVLCEFLNFSAAAEAMYMTQPALSRHISSLESSLDLRLFERTTQSVVLTPAGELFRDRIKPLLQDYDDILSELRLMKSGFSSRLRVSCPYYAIHDYLAQVPERFAVKHPDIRLQYSVGDPQQAMQFLLEGKVDVAIIPKYQMPRVEGLVSRDVYTENLGVLLSKSDPLSAKDSLSLTELKDHTFFSVSNSYFTSSWHHTQSLCRKAGFEPAPPALFNQMEALIMAIRNGDGITVVGHHMRSQESELVAFRPLVDEGCSRTISLWYAPDSDNPALEKFVRIFEEVKLGGVYGSGR